MPGCLKLEVVYEGPLTLTEPHLSREERRGPLSPPSAQYQGIAVTGCRYSVLTIKEEAWLSELSALGSVSSAQEGIDINTDRDSDYPTRNLEFPFY